MTNNDGWGTPVPANNIMLQTQNAAQEMAKVAETLVNDGWTQTAHDEFTKTVSTQEALTDWGGDSVAWGNYVERNYTDDGAGNLTAKTYEDSGDGWSVMAKQETVFGDTPVPTTWGDWNVTELTEPTTLDVPLYFWHAESGSGVIAHTAEDAERFTEQGLYPVSAETYVQFTEQEAASLKTETDEAMARAGFVWAGEDNAYFNPETGLYVQPDDAGDYLALDRDTVLNDTDEARARAANACMSADPQTPWVVDVPDGELTLKEDYMPTVTTGEETGVYVAYSQGVLHAVLAGPYTDVAAARLKLDEVWRRFEADPAMPHAFTKSDWNRAGLYMAEIPLKARRKGAYGAI